MKKWLSRLRDYLYPRCEKHPEYTLYRYNTCDECIRMEREGLRNRLREQRISEIQEGVRRALEAKRGNP
jgi:hypothetical protein